MYGIIIVVSVILENVFIGLHPYELDSYLKSYTPEFPCQDTFTPLSTFTAFKLLGIAGQVSAGNGSVFTLNHVLKLLAALPLLQIGVTLK